MAVISVLLPDYGHSTSHTVPPHTVPPCFSTMRDYTPNWDPESALLPQLACVRYLTTAMRRTGTTSGHSQCPSSPQALKVSETQALGSAHASTCTVFPPSWTSTCGAPWEDAFVWERMERAVESPADAAVPGTRVLWRIA